MQNFSSKASIYGYKYMVSTHQSHKQESNKHSIKIALAEMKLVFPVVLLLIALVAQNQLMVESQPQSGCAASLSTLNVCSPFMVPGAASSPSADCCSALQSVGQDCLCSTLRIASRIPTQCNLPPLSCTN